MINSKNIFITVLFIIFCSAAFAQEVFKNDEVTVSKLDKGVYVMETFDKTTMYIVEGAKRALLIDTGTKCDSLDKIVRKITSKPFDVVLTHNHGDHSGNIQYFDEVYMHPADTVLELNKKFTGKYKWLNEGDVFDLGGGRKIETLLMPGHTPGSVVLLDKTINAVYTGDAFGSGHVWLQLRPHLSMKIYHKSCVRMEKIMQEQNITKIYCGHYPSVKHAFGMSYIIEMKNLAEKISAGDTVGSQPYPVPSRNNKAVFLQDGEALIVFDPENINDRKDVLILLVHPDIKTSKANAALINAVKDFPYVKIINMYDEPF
ncbi:MAG: MBL fold metallo-hydrolase, partial [Prevotellaceae bacterium]|nr:MBL fold metallo-hydrolase [Prevotellaceae bacterium]